MLLYQKTSTALVNFTYAFHNMHLVFAIVTKESFSNRIHTFMYSLNTNLYPCRWSNFVPNKGSAHSEVSTVKYLICGPEISCLDQHSNSIALARPLRYYFCINIHSQFYANLSWGFECPVIEFRSWIASGPPIGGNGRIFFLLRLVECFPLSA